MFKIDEELTIHITRGDAASFEFSAIEEGGADDGSNDEGTEDSKHMHEFKPGDVIRLKVMERKGCDQVVLSKDFLVESTTYKVEIILNREDTKFGEVISKPVDYWYEIELNPDIQPETIIGYDEDGAKIFRVFPEGGD